MTQDNNQPTIQSWWDTVSFPSKNLYELNEQGELTLKAIAGFGSRIISTLQADNAEAAFKALTDKFTEVTAKFTELQNEWNSTEDKLKLVGKADRLKDYLLHSVAIGDYEPLLNGIAEMNKTIQQLTDNNYQAKLTLVEQAEALAGNDNLKETSQAFKDITEQWKTIGHVDKNRNDELWNRLEAARNKFFEHKRSAKEEMNKEMLQNLDLKMELVEKAEALADSENWKDTTEVFRQLMEDWKKTGRTIADKNEELWNRFIAAKNNFYDRKKLHFENIQQEQEANLAAKMVLLQKAEELKDSTDWQNTAQQYAELMEQWKQIGRVPVEKADEIWNAFTAAKEHFFQAKKQHFESYKVSLEDNYAQKLALLKRAESIKNSSQWRETTDELIELMNEWKKIGPVPREHSNRIWEQFLAARKVFFDRKDANRENRKQRMEQQKVNRLHQTEDFLQKMEEELKDEQDKLEDFRNGIQNITPGHKEAELRAHLEKLIKQTESKVTHKIEKIESLKKQLEEIKAANEKGSAE